MASRSKGTAPGILIGVRFAALLLTLASVAWPVSADEPDRVGLVIQTESGEVLTRCVEWPAEEGSGADLLIRSGLDVVMDTGSGMGVIVCQVEGEGCAFPGQACFCQCMGGGECAYWNYFYRDPGHGAWAYSIFGAAVHKVKSGSVDAWVWGDGKDPPSDDLTFNSICAQPTPTVTAAIEVATESPTPHPTAPEASVTPPAATTKVAGDPTATERALMPATSTAAATPRPTEEPAGAPIEGEATPASYWPFGLMLLGLAGIGAFVWLRRR